MWQEVPRAAGENAALRNDAVTPNAKKRKNNERVQS
jgi:hypothetical protein